jgi:hypothetical protein
MKKNTKNGNQTLTNVPLANKKAQPKNQKKLLLCREPGGALGKGACAEGGPSAQTCALPMAQAGSRQWPVNRGKPLSMPLPRALEGALGIGCICADGLTAEPSAQWTAAQM